MNDKIDEKIFLERLSNLDNYEKTFLLKLKRKYDYYNIAFKSDDDMRKAEDDIYKVGDVTLSDNKRVIVELSRIINTIDNKNEKKYISSAEINNIKTKIKEISNFNSELNNNAYDEVIINKFKKNISYMQIILGLNTNFFKATIDLFRDYYRNIMIDKESKKVL